MAKKPTNRDPRIVSPIKQENAQPIYGNVEYVRPEVTALQYQYDIIRDCIDGSRNVKNKREIYLPQPNTHDPEEYRVKRYISYVARAVFYNVTRRTLYGLVGQVFLQEPVIEVPPLLDPVVKDANGSGVSLKQLAKAVQSYVVAYGRSGVLADYPKTDGPATRAQQQAGEIRPTITAYAPWNIINWRTITRGSRVLLSLVVLKEEYDKSDDGFEAETATQYRVLKLVNNVYTVEIWREGIGSGGFMPIAEETVTPTDARGNLLDEIPFMFVGAENNDPEPDAPPLYDIADLNIAHYRNSADYEESVFMLGQPTPWFAGLTQDWVDNVMKGTVALGSRAGISLPVGGTTGLLQAQPNTLAKEAMDTKERQMVALGAKLVEQKSVQRTAEEASQDKASETSSLATMTENVNSAMQWVLEWCGIFSGAVTVREDAKDSENKKIRFELNTEFEISKLSSEQIRMVIESWVKEAITTDEMRHRLRQTGLAFEDKKKYDAWVKTEEEKSRENMEFSAGLNPNDIEE